MSKTSLCHQIPQRENPGASAERVLATRGEREASDLPRAGTLAPAFGQAIPSLEEISTGYRHELHGELLFQLCEVLVEVGLGTPEAWRQCGGSPLVFAQHAIMSGIGAERGDLLQRNVEYFLQVSDVVDRGGANAELEGGRLAITITCGGCGYIRIGPAIHALEKQAKGLGAAFYWTFVHALYRIMRIYDHSDALVYRENLEEYQREVERQGGPSEFPDVKAALPKFLRSSAKRRKGDTDLCRRRLLRRYRSGKFGPWIERLRKIHRLSRMKFKVADREMFDGYCDGPPVPSLLVAFEENDPIVACFDEESQHMLEYASEPTLAAAFSPRRPEEVMYALRLVDRFVELNYELFLLAEDLKKWEEGNGSTDRNRREPALSTP